jgi:hypothetical protein
MVRAQLCEAPENTMDSTIAAGAHKWKCILCVSPDIRNEPAAQHCVASMPAKLHILLGEIERCAS